MDGAPDLLILNSRPEKGKHLGSKPQLAELTRHGIGRELVVMGFDVSAFPLSNSAFWIRPPETRMRPMVPSSYFIGNAPLGAGGDEIDLAGRQIGDVGVVSETKPMALLRLLPAEIEVKSVERAVVIEIDLHPIGTGHSQAQFFRLGADLAVINRQAAAENCLVHTMEE